MWESTEMNKEVGYWLRKEMATEWGGHVVTEWTMVPVSEFKASHERVYGYEEIEGDSQFYTDEGCTHVIRCINGSPFDLVDGIDLYIKIDGDSFELVSEVDSPDLMGEEYKEAQVWLRNVAEPIDA